ncbi:hypothetical protein BN1723_003378 [Verticillium longisporum]|uniref:Major facilitator superfamily (MFS) profile domain-containing protein n=1 Tax=Verticillium longisporum TaxID=100787 RepID=A0A0G4LVH0_VERLO|nr:hypothetical protein BN1723_003378 [Verticillium longisporum]
MPMNFSAKRKWTIVGFVAAITFLTPFASTILAPAIGFLAEDFSGNGEADLTMASFPISIYLLGYAVGPLFLSPLSEIYGRHIVLSSANAFFCVWLIGCALAPSLNALIVFRFLTGVGGSGCLTIGGGIIADIIPVHQRGRAITIWMLGPLIGPTIGPLIGAFVAQDIGWRWTGWIVLAASVPMVVAIAILSQETNARVLIQRKTDRLRIELNRPDLRSVYVDANAAPQSKSMVLARGLTRPLKMLFLSPLLFSLSLYIAFCYGPEQFTRSNEMFGLSHYPEDNNHFFRSDGRIPTWEEYYIGPVHGETPTVYTNAHLEGIEGSSVYPQEKQISVNSGECVRFQFSKLCEHWTSERHGLGKPPLLLLSIGGRDGRKKEMVPMDMDGYWWWLDVNAIDLGAPGEGLSIFMVTKFDGKDGRGLSKEEFLAKRGRVGMAFAGIIKWDLI